MFDKLSFCIYKNGTNYPITDSCHFFFIILFFPPKSYYITVFLYFFLTYLRQSSVTATRMIIPSNINCRLVSMPRIVSE